MPADVVQVKLVVDSPGEDQELIEEDLQYLLEELTRIDAESIERKSAGPAPPGTRGDSLKARAPGSPMNYLRPSLMSDRQMTSILQSPSALPSQ